MNRPEPCKPSAQRLTARGVLGAPQTFAFSCPASIPLRGRNSPARSGWEANKGVGQRGEAGGNGRGRQWGAAGPAEAALPQLVRGRDGYADLEQAGPAGCRLHVEVFAGVWQSGTPVRPAGRGGRGGNALGVSGTVPRHTSRPLARTQVFSASRSPPQGRGGPRCASVTCSGRLRPCWSTELPPPGPQTQPRPSHQVFTRHHTA